MAVSAASGSPSRTASSTARCVAPKPRRSPAECTSRSRADSAAAIPDHRVAGVVAPAQLDGVKLPRAREIAAPSDNPTVINHILGKLGHIG